MENVRGSRAYRRRSVEIALASVGVTTTAIVSLFFVGSAKDQYQAIEKNPSSITHAYLKSLASLTENITPNDSCSVNTPSFGKFEPAALAMGTSSNIIETSIYDTYGLAVDFVKSPIAVGKFYTAEPLTNVDEADKIIDLDILQESLSNFDPNVIRALKIGNIAFAKSLTGNSSAVLKHAGGLYLDTSLSPVSEIFVVPDVNTQYIEHTIVHEIGHAIDTELLCNPTDSTNDETFSDFNTVPYRETDSNQILTIPGSRQEFATDYAETNVKEDRAETLADTIVDRGLILPDDPEWNSPFQKKQMEIVRRLEQLSPGFTKYLISKTMKMDALKQR